VVTQNKAEKPKLYKGPGIIRQDEDGNLVFKIYATSVENTNLFIDFRGQLSPQSGKIYEAEDFYTLAASDYHGGRWTAERVLPDSSWYGERVLTIGSLETVSLSGLLSDDRTKGPNYLRMHFFTSADVPCTHFKDLGDGITGDGRRNFASFDALNCHFEVSRFSDEFVIEASASSAFPPFFNSRILETLQFVLARSLGWRVLIEQENGGVISTQFASPKRSSKTKLDPPIGSVQIDAAAFSWQLFARYLEFVTREATSYFWHSCSAQLHDACEASANSMDAWALGLCVAVEGISNLLTVEVLSDAEKEEVEKIRRLVKIWTKCRRWSPGLRDRALGLLSQLNNARVQDRLTPLGGLGKVEPAYIKSWSDLRHQRAHGRLRDPNKMSVIEFQQIFSLMNQVTVLLYQITFHLVGYEGKYTDYGEIGYPTKMYPLVSGVDGGSND
jgi:hypothetical protein